MSWIGALKKGAVGVRPCLTDEQKAAQFIGKRAKIYANIM